MRRSNWLLTFVLVVSCFVGTWAQTSLPLAWPVVATATIPSDLPPLIVNERTRIMAIKVTSENGQQMGSLGVPIVESYGTNTPTYVSWVMDYAGMRVVIVLLPPSNMLITSPAPNEDTLNKVLNVPGASKAIVQSSS